MVANTVESPACPHCGEAFEGRVTTPFWHWVDCGFCLRRYKAPGNPHAPLPPYHRPFWTDQFRLGREDRVRPPAALDGLMLAIVALFGFCGLLVIATTIAEIIRFALK